jgi:hypothetical protein
VPQNLVFQKKRIYLTRQAGMETRPALVLPATLIPLVIPTEVEGSRLSHSKERHNFSSPAGLETRNTHTEGPRE